jgi:hypothetical protein
MPAMRLKKMNFLVLLTVLLFASCGGSGESDMVGEWIITDDKQAASELITIREDGKYIVSENSGELAGEWHTDDKGNLFLQAGSVTTEYMLVDKTPEYMSMSLQGLGRGKVLRFYRFEDYKKQMSDLNIQAPRILEEIEELSEEDRSNVDLTLLDIKGKTASMEQKFDDGRQFQMELLLTQLVLSTDKSIESWTLSNFTMGNPPKYVAETFLKAMKTGDFDIAKKHATKEASASIDMMAGMGDGKGGNADEIQLQEVKQDGDKCKVFYTDAGKEMTLKLVKEDGEWKAAWEKGGPAD